MIDNKAMQVKEAKPIHADGTWTYIILTLSPCKQSGGEKINANESAAKSKIKKTELIKLINFPIKLNKLPTLSKLNILFNYYNIIFLGSSIISPIENRRE